MVRPIRPGDEQMTFPNHSPLRKEDLRFNFAPSEQLADRLWALTKPEYRNQMGRRGLMLYSDTSVQVTRRLDGTLDPEDARMISELRKIVASKPADSHRTLSRSIGGGLVRDRLNGRATGVQVNLGVILDTATKVLVHKSKLVPKEKLFVPNGVDAHIVLPIEQVVDRPEFDEKYAELQHFVRGDNWSPDLQEADRRTPSLTIGAYVTNMHVGHR